MIRFNVDGEHKDRKVTRTKIVIDDNGIGLRELINIRGNLYYFIMLPEDIANFVAKRNHPLKDTNYNYIAIGQSSFGFSNRCWQVDPINNNYIYRWFSEHNSMSIIRDNLNTLEEIEAGVNLFIRRHKLLAFR